MLAIGKYELNEWEDIYKRLFKTLQKFKMKVLCLRLISGIIIKIA